MSTDLDPSAGKCRLKSHGTNIQDPAVLLERNVYGYPFVGFVWERQFEKVLVENGWETGRNWECLLMHHDKGFSLSVYVDEIK